MRLSYLILETKSLTPELTSKPWNNSITSDATIVGMNRHAQTCLFLDTKIFFHMFKSQYVLYAWLYVILLCICWPWIYLSSVAIIGECHHAPFSISSSLKPSLLFSFFLLVLFIFKNCMYFFLCTCKYGCSWRLDRVLDLLELQLQAILSTHIGGRNST